MKTIGEHMKDARIAAGLTQRQLAALTNLTHTGIGHYERNDRSPGILVCIALADALNLSLDELVGRDFKKE